MMSGTSLPPGINDFASKGEHLDSNFSCCHDVTVRTTVTLDADVERLLKNEAHAQGKTFKSVLNNSVRQALQPARGQPRRKPFAVKARPLGLRAGIDPARLSELADEQEIDAFLAATRRLRRKKR